tara:strand:+ start:690 stop:851 length:162 start_codon:yes stop_codon:yes gene_type:complete
MNQGADQLGMCHIDTRNFDSVPVCAPEDAVVVVAYHRFTNPFYGRIIIKNDPG